MATEDDDKGNAVIIIVLGLLTSMVLGCIAVGIHRSGFGMVPDTSAINSLLAAAITAQASVIAISVSVALLSIQIISNRYSPKMTSFIFKNKIFSATIIVLVMSISLDIILIFNSNMYDRPKSSWIATLSIFLLYFTCSILFVTGYAIFSSVREGLRRGTPEGILTAFKEQHSPESFAKKSREWKENTTESHPLEGIYNMANRSITNRETRAALLAITVMREIVVKSTPYLREDNHSIEISDSLEPIFTNYLPNLFISSYHSGLKNISDESINSIIKISGVDSTIYSGKIAVEAFGAFYTILIRTSWESTNERLLSNCLDSISDILLGLGNTQQYNYQSDLIMDLANSVEDGQSELDSDLYMRFAASALDTLVECRIDIAEENDIIQSDRNTPNYNPELEKRNVLFRHLKSFHLTHPAIAKILIDSIRHTRANKELINEISDPLVKLCGESQSNFPDLQTVRSFQFALEISLYSIQFNESTLEEWGIIFSKIMEKHDPEMVRAVFQAINSKHKSQDAIIESKYLGNIENKEEKTKELIERADKNYRKRTWSYNHVHRNLVESERIDGVELSVIQEEVNDEYVSMIAEDSNGYVVKVSIIKVLNDSHLDALSKDGLARSVIITAVDESERSTDAEIIVFDQSKHSIPTQRNLYEYLINSDVMDEYDIGSDQKELTEFI